MLTTNQTKPLNGRGRRFAIIASSYNSEYVDSMMQAAVRELKKAGARDYEIVRVPGAFEIPVTARLLATREGAVPEVIICLGVILRGETEHARLIGEAVTQALMRLQLDHRLPIVHEVLLLENPEQARVRCLDKKRNRGTEAAQTALAMAHVLTDLAPDVPF